LLTETRITLKNTGKINPENINEYIESGGYAGLEKALKMQPVEVIDEMLTSSLRGRGGAGFSAGLKEKFTNESAQKRDRKFLICNADEGEPGTFKDRIIMETDPHRLIEGMIIAAYSIGAQKSFVYLRAEYHRSIFLVTKAIEQAYEKGYLGKNILASNYSLEMEIRLGAGSYLCGEELTLLESLEGKRGYPRIKPPFPAEVGLFGYPTLVNNVETLATIPSIIEKGSEWYLKLGTQDSPGTKIFTISGDVKNPGFYEVEMGATLRELIYVLAGGIKDDKKLKAVLIGGAAGTFVDETVLDTAISYDSLKAKGAVLGSGAIVVMSEDRSVPDMLGSILKFFKHESCGKCVPCRVGTTQLVEMYGELTHSNGNKKTSLDDMISEAEYIAKTSLCPLGQSPILPLRSLKRYFANQF
jgi:NADH:ubiquinone oxidoreductase subunit F (NADH-binding)